MAGGMQQPLLLPVAPSPTAVNPNSSLMPHSSVPPIQVVVFRARDYPTLPALIATLSKVRA